MAIITDADIRLELEQMDHEPTDNVGSFKARCREEYLAYKACWSRENPYGEEWEEEIAASDDPLWI